MDVFDDDFGEVLAMSVFAAIAFAAFLFEDNHFIAFYERFLYFADNFCPFDERCAYFDSAVDVGKENAVELYSVAFVHFFTQVVHIEKAVFFGFELLALDFYDNVHL